MKIRVLITDDHTILRAGLRLLINGQPDMEVVAEAANGAEAVEQARQTKPDVVVMDITMGEQPGILATTNILQVCPQTKVLILTMHTDPAYARMAVAVGAAGYVVKSAADTEFIAGIRAVASGRTFVDLTLDDPSAREKTFGLTDHRKQTKSKKPLSRLSAREREVLRLVAQGFTNLQTAEQLDLSVKSVETYRARLMEKLGLYSRADLVRFALHCGILTPGQIPPDYHQPIDPD